MLSRRDLVQMSLLFGTLYFIQGVAEPTEGLIAQPVRSRLGQLGESQSRIGGLMALLALPWLFKPFLGLLIDFVPIGGLHRRPYLLAASLATAGSLLLAFLLPFDAEEVLPVLALLGIATLGVALGDVVVDSLAVENGQRHRQTGLLQAVQWGAMYGAVLLVGSLGGFFAEHRTPRLCFAVCALAAMAAFALTLRFVRESPLLVAAAPPRKSFPSLATALRDFVKTIFSPTVLKVGSFLFLWNFNPFSSAVLQAYVTNELELGEQFYGNMISLGAVGSLSACGAYPFVCRRLPLHWLLQVSVLLGVVSTLAYLALDSRETAIAVSLVVGFTYMLGTLIQLDLAARVCVPKTAGVTFASLMAISNLGLTLSMACGGWWYDALAISLTNRHAAFYALVGIGAGFSATCWLLLPQLAHCVAQIEASDAHWETGK